MKKRVIVFLALIFAQFGFVEAFILTGIENNTTYPIVVNCVLRSELIRSSDICPRASTTLSGFGLFNCLSVGAFDDALKTTIDFLNCLEVLIRVQDQDGRLYIIWQGDMIESNSKVFPGIWISECPYDKSSKLLNLMCSITTCERRPDDSKFKLIIKEYAKKCGKGGQNTRLDFELLLEESE